MATKVTELKISRDMTTSNNLRRRKITQTIAFGLVWLSGFAAIALLIWIVGYVLLQGAQEINIEFLTTKPAGGVSGEGGMSTTIVTTFYLVVLIITIASPLGVGAALYLVEYAGEASRESKLMARLIRIARNGVEILAGVPSIIFGLFGFALFVSALKFKFSLLSAGLSGACLVLPVIIRTSEEALLAVPRSYREASLGLGANKWQTLIRVTIPASLSGIIAAVMLGMGRAIGETMTVLMACGNAPAMPTSFLDSVRTMTATIAIELGETVQGDIHYRSLFIIGFVLFLMTFLVNLVSDLVLQKYQQVGR